MNRKISFEILRIICCFFVIVDHTIYYLFNSIGMPKGINEISGLPISFIIGIAYLYISKIAVPVFLMISGALLIKKDETYTTVFKERFLKVLAVVVLFSCIYYIDSVINNSNVQFNLKNYFYLVYIGEITPTYWYLYAYLGILLMLPIIRKMLLNFSNKDYFYYISLNIAFIGIMPMLNKYVENTKFSPEFSVPLLGTCIGYFVIGHFIENKMNTRYVNKKCMIFCWLLLIMSIIIPVLISAREYIVADRLGSFSLNNVSYIHVMISSICIFYITKYYSEIKFSEKIKRIILSISKCTFGIYLLGSILIFKLEFVYNNLINYFPHIIALIMYEMLVFITGYLAINLIKKIPFSNKLI